MGGATLIVVSPDDDDENDNDDGNESGGDECSYLAKDLLLEIDNSVTQHDANLDNTKT